MIIFISDLHLTDGTFDYKKDDPENHIPHDVSHEAFKLFWNQVYRIYAANKKDCNIKEIKLVLLGDIFEMRSTTRWIKFDHNEDENPEKTKYRPWKEDIASPSKVCKEILEEILSHNEETLRYLSPKKFDDIKEDNGLKELIKELGKDKIKVEYVSGNHDRLINYYDGDVLIKEYIEGKLGWSIPKVTEDKGFKFEDKELGVLADHGHKIDFIDYYANDYKSAPIGALLSDLLGRLMYHVQNENNKELICFCMDIDNVRPSSDRFEWVVSNINSLSGESLEILKKVLKTGIQELKEDADEIFDFLYERVKGKFKFIHKFLLKVIGIFTDKEKFLKKWITKRLDKIEQILEKEKDLKTTFDYVLSFASKLMPKKKKKKDQQDQDFHYYERAEEESKKGYSYVVFGHSHRYKLIPLTVHKGKKVFYFNSGTWKKTVQKNLFPIETKESIFQKWTRMTYITFFDWQKQENKDHIFDVWHGNLQTEDEV